MTEGITLVYANDGGSKSVPGFSPHVISQVGSFHRELPDYNETPLIPLPNVAREFNVGHVLVKDESLRFGLPSFKILGASWAVHQAVAAKVGLPRDAVGLKQLASAARAASVDLLTCTDGNWGRAVSRMAKLLGVAARVYVPKTMDAPTQDRIRSEGAEVIVVPGDYDDAIRAAEADSKDGKRLLVQDTSWPGYEEIPAWVVEGYSTLLVETDRQVQDLTARPADLVIVSAGVGSLAQAVASHYKNQKPSPARVVAVEPTAAACVRTSLKAGKIVPIKTGETIMDGMNCGTVSSIAWPVLSDGLDACVSVTDLESHRAVKSMHAQGVKAGPCGAAPLAALSRIRAELPQYLRPDSVIILLCTEGWRPYLIPN